MTFDDWFLSASKKRFPTLLEAWNAGYTAFANELCEKCGQTRQHAGVGCIHCITEWCKDKVKEARAERDDLAR